jgi:LmbE family N-acetylglucosaminyl deacetylase
VMVGWGIASVIVLLWLTWAAGFVVVTDFTLPMINRRQAGAFRRVLVVFPHADDEAVTCAGYLHLLSQRGCAVTLVLLTMGERGTPDGRVDLQLKDVRAHEAQQVALLLGLARCIQADFGDGMLRDRMEAVRAFLTQTIWHEHPDLLITYDRDGLYGHADHIVCATIITDLRARLCPSVPLWYVTLPSRVLARVRLPEHLDHMEHLPAGTDDRVALLHPMRAAPASHATHKVFVGCSVIPKIRAWYTYGSQRGSLTAGVLRALPMWFFLSMVLFEYFVDSSQQ